MAGPPTYPDRKGNPSGDNRVRPDAGSPPITPRWVRVSIIVSVILVLLFVILHLTGNGFSGLHGHVLPSSTIAVSVEQALQHL